MRERRENSTATENQTETTAGELTLRPAAPEAEPTAAPAPAPETMPSLEELLRRAELAAQEHHDAWLRARAEADNIRKRAQAEIASAHRFAVETFAAELLAVKDSLEAALAVENRSAESMMGGVELTLKQLKSVFERFSVTESDPLGQKFDPHRHQAIGTVESDAEPGTVVQVLRKGYLLHERVIRPALVTVAKARGS
ncbi:MAG: nucleotide exchange factor GrpE [Betaproteobacteria bacterium]|nr:nucleotide exchange factor GrpE [Betaproteobacteria bacterium]